MKVEDFLQYYVQNAPQLMWFLGAGASRSAGMPSATDIIWDLKRIFYCTRENQSITDNELSNEAIRNRIQSYLDGLNCPGAGSDIEYSFYFKLVLGDEPENHQRYLRDKLDSQKGSINSGHRVLSALIEMQKARIIFTTNFDNVLEDAHSLVTGRNLHAYSLDGSSAVVNALNNEDFPIYAKMHGDFRYFELKNLPEQLVVNDKKIEECFLNATCRYGMLVAGYSGRDKNVMEAFRKAIKQPNAFPKGLFWLTSFHGFIFPDVTELIIEARNSGINAQIVEVGTFDVFLSRIWKILEDKPRHLDSKIKRGVFQSPIISRYSGSETYPVIRTNAFPILQMPTCCRAIETKFPLSQTEFIQKVKEAETALIFSKQESILYWGPQGEVGRVFRDIEIANQCDFDLGESLKTCNSLTQAFLSRALARSLVKDKAVKLMKSHGFHAVVSVKHKNFPQIENILKDALRVYDYKEKSLKSPKELAGKVPGVADAYWMESAELTLDYFDNRYWLVITPSIWIEPEAKRRQAKDFIISKRKNRYNLTQNALLEAWKTILIGTEQEVTVTPFDQSEVNQPRFKIGNISAYSKRYAL